jgi:pyridoxine 5-phosphate synthase
MAANGPGTNGLAMNGLAPHLRLGVNVDHVATVRNARGGAHPDPVRAALAAQDAGADGITAHLREDRRHITDVDILRLRAELDIPLNLEMAATDEMLAIALKHKPHAVCLVPEKREERTTEGGLDVASAHNVLAPFVARLTDSGIRVSLFIEADARQLDAAKHIGAPVVELHTGSYCDALLASDRTAQLNRIQAAAAHCGSLGLECHAGHGLSFDTVGPIAAIPAVRELNIGHFLVGEAIFTGFAEAVKRMRAEMDRARTRLAIVRADE